MEEGKYIDLSDIQLNISLEKTIETYKELLNETVWKLLCHIASLLSSFIIFAYGSLYVITSNDISTCFVLFMLCILMIANVYFISRSMIDIKIIRAKLDLCEN